LKHLTIKLILAWGLGLCLTLAVVIPLGSLGAISSVAIAAERTVCGLPTCAYTNVQAAVDDAAPGDVIKVAAGTYTGVYTRLVSPYGTPRVFTQMVYISKSVTICGGYTSAFTEPPNPQANLTTLDAQGQGRVAFIDYGASPTLEGLRFTGGDASKGNTWSDYSYYAGGGLLIEGNNTVLSGNIIIDNQAEAGAGLYLFNGSTVLTNNVITGNNALVYGGGVSIISAGITMGGNQILNNTASSGGGVFVEAVLGSLGGNIIRGNEAEKGGGLYLEYGGTVLTNSSCHPCIKTKE
jgi:hypothetical protein